MVDAINLIGVECAREIFTRAEREPVFLTGLIKELEGRFSKQTISKYIAQMEMVGVLISHWEKAENGRWRMYYSPGQAEWARMFREVIELEHREAEPR